jgi:hypothetical protein
MPSGQELEPLFSRQEQGVVYLFSRYWEEIPVFKGMKMLRIQVRFPDCSIVSAVDGKNQKAVEFEYGLSSFRSHLASPTLRKLYSSEGVRQLYVVYWERNADETELKKAIRRKTPLAVTPVCLKDYFQAVVKEVTGTDNLQSFWRFTPKASEEAYPLGKITEDEEQLEEEGSVVRLNHNPNLYRVIGLNKEHTGFIECDHWTKIHFYTARGISADRVPGRLYVKPNGCDYFDGYFEIKRAFRVKKRANEESLGEFWRKYYFYPYQEYRDVYRGAVCLVCNFKPLEFGKGRRLHKYLKDKIRLGTQSCVTIEDPKHIAGVNVITTR